MKADENVLCMRVLLERGKFLEERSHFQKMMEVINKVGGLIPLSMGVGPPPWGVNNEDCRQIFSTSLIISERSIHGLICLTTNARMVLIWTFGADDQDVITMKLEDSYPSAMMLTSMASESKAVVSSATRYLVHENRDVRNGEAASVAQFG